MAAMALLLVFFMTVDSTNPAFASATPSLTILNLIGDDTPLYVKCEDRFQNNLGQALHYDQSCAWAPNWPTWFESTIWTCYFSWGSKVQSFVAWIDLMSAQVEHLPWHPCVRCKWDVHADGFYLLDVDDPKVTYTLVYRIL